VPVASDLPGYGLVQSQNLGSRCLRGEGNDPLRPRATVFTGNGIGGAAELLGTALHVPQAVFASVAFFGHTTPPIVNHFAQ